jgi:hypothetical protein
MVLQNTFCSSITFCIDFSISKAYKRRRKKHLKSVIDLGIHIATKNPTIKKNHHT